MKNDWSSVIDNFKNFQILVIGDIMLDRFVWGKVNRISQEAPVPIVNVKNIDNRLGGAGNVLNNIISLGGNAFLCGLVGNDKDSIYVKEKLESMNLSTEGLIIDDTRSTTVKTRVIAQRQQLIRYDFESITKANNNILDKIDTIVSMERNNISLIIVSDYGKGVITEDVMSFLKIFSSHYNIPLIVDPNVENSMLYKGVDLISPNHHEADKMVNNGQDIEVLGKELLKKIECKSVLITRGKMGMSLFEKDGSITHIMSVAKNVFDVAGAGDTVIATLGLCLASGLDIYNSIYLSNIAAGIVVGEVGTTPIDVHKLKEELQEMERKDNVL
jgi:D-glycero-beta-D-manno-heptose-7-phosphate kinase